jgi:hypothetical protein
MVLRRRPRGASWWCRTSSPRRACWTPGPPSPRRKERTVGMRACGWCTSPRAGSTPRTSTTPSSQVHKHPPSSPFFFAFAFYPPHKNANLPSTSPWPRIASPHSLQQTVPSFIPGAGALRFGSPFSRRHRSWWSCGHTLFFSHRLLRYVVYRSGAFGRLGHGDTNGEARPRAVEALAKQRIRWVACGWDTTAAVTGTPPGLLHARIAIPVADTPPLDCVPLGGGVQQSAASCTCGAAESPFPGSCRSPERVLCGWPRCALAKPTPPSSQVCVRLFACLSFFLSFILSWRRAIGAQCKSD